MKRTAKTLIWVWHTNRRCRCCIIFLVIAFASLLSGCSSRVRRDSGGALPSNVVSNFVVAVQRRDYSAARTYWNPDAPTDILRGAGLTFEQFCAEHFDCDGFELSAPLPGKPGIVLITVEPQPIGSSKGYTCSLEMIADKWVIVHPSYSYTRQSEQQGRLRVLSYRIQKFYATNGKLPAALEELPPMEGFDNRLHDAWGHGFSATQDGDQCLVVSAGKDGELGTQDDVSHAFSLSTDKEIGVDPSARLPAQIPEPQQRVYSYADVVRKMDVLRSEANRQMPEYSHRVVHPSRPSGGFDPNTYFTVLEHVSLATGSVLDYVYYRDGLGGHPCLYIRKATDSALPDYPAYEKVYGEHRMYGDVRRILDALQLDGSPESYFEFVVFAELAGMFQLYWHSAHHREIVVTKDDLVRLLDTWWHTAAKPEVGSRPWGLDKHRRVFNRISPVDRSKVLQADPKPSVEMGTANAGVSIMLFSEGRGLLRRKYRISRVHPRRLLDTPTEELLPHAAVPR